MLILDALDQNDIYEVNEDLTSVSNQIRRQNRIAQISVEIKINIYTRMIDSEICF